MFLPCTRKQLAHGSNNEVVAAVHKEATIELLLPCTQKQLAHGSNKHVAASVTTEAAIARQLAAMQSTNHSGSYKYNPTINTHANWEYSTGEFDIVLIGNVLIVTIDIHPKYSVSYQSCCEV